MSLGTLETIIESLQTVTTKLDAVIASLGTPPDPDVTNSETGGKAAAKKTTAKKTAAKKTAAKRGKGPDLSDITIFKKQLFDVAESSGVADVMPKLKAFIKSQDYASSDEVEVDDRAEFLDSVKAHFAELGDEDGSGGGELDDF